MGMPVDYWIETAKEAQREKDADLVGAKGCVCHSFECALILSEKAEYDYDAGHYKTHDERCPIALAEQIRSQP